MDAVVIVSLSSVSFCKKNPANQTQNTEFMGFGLFTRNEILYKNVEENLDF